MNDSGRSIRACLDWFGWSAEQLLVLVDDMDLELGRLRLRASGSAGGHNGVALRSQGDPVLFLDNPAGVDATARRAMLDTLGEFNHLAAKRHGDPETLTRIAQYEMAFRMQTSVPELTDISAETPATLDLRWQPMR